MERSTTLRLAGFAGFVLLVAAIASGLPGRFFGGAPRAVALIAAAERPAMPAIELPRVGGGTWRLADEKGKVVLLNFWATWCPPCRVETPELISLHRRFENSGFTAVGISLDEKPELVPPFVQRFRIPYPVVLPTPTFTLANHIEALPTTLLIDRSGRLARSHSGVASEETFAADIERLLREESR